MIVYDLECTGGSHRFEGWFKSSEDFAGQQARGLLTCPFCGSAEVRRAVQAPRLARKGNQMTETRHRGPAQPQLPAAPVSLPATASAPVSNAPMPPKVVEMLDKLVQMQAEALKTSRYVGESFAEDARAMHYGEKDAETIHGQATLREAQELLEEGIAVMPLPFPSLPPEQAN